MPYDNHEYLKELEQQQRQRAEKVMHDAAFEPAAPHYADYLNAGAANAAMGIVQQESLLHRLQRRANDGASEQRKYQRAADILAQHPEFEELFELMRIVPPSSIY